MADVSYIKELVDVINPFVQRLYQAKEEMKRKAEQEMECKAKEESERAAIDWEDRVEDASAHFLFLEACQSVEWLPWRVRLRVKRLFADEVLEEQHVVIRNKAKKVKTTRRIEADAKNLVGAYIAWSSNLPTGALDGLDSDTKKQLFKQAVEEERSCLASQPGAETNRS